MVEGSEGDARAALIALKPLFMIALPDESGLRHITMETAVRPWKKRPRFQDKAGEEHYNVISAFIVDARERPDAALTGLPGWWKPEKTSSS